MFLEAQLLKFHDFTSTTGLWNIINFKFLPPKGIPHRLLWWTWHVADRSTICDFNLFQNYVQSTRGTSAHCLMIRQNSQWYSILPAIGFHSVLALTVQDDTFNQKKFEHFSKHDLVSTSFFTLLINYKTYHVLHMNRHPAVNSILVCDNAKSHRGGSIHGLCNEADVMLI